MMFRDFFGAALMMAGAKIMHPEMLAKAVESIKRNTPSIGGCTHV